MLPFAKTVAKTSGLHSGERTLEGYFMPEVTSDLLSAGFTDIAARKGPWV